MSESRKDRSAGVSISRRRGKRPADVTQTTKGNRRPPRRTGGSPGRVAAANALVRAEDGAHIEDILGRAKLDSRDRGHAWFLAFGLLRHRASVDACLRPHLRQPIGGLDPEVRAVLRLGAFEKVHGRAATHAVVNEWVEVVKSIGSPRASGLVNAVMRRVEKVALTEDEVLEHPAWILDRWRERYGAAATEAWAKNNNEQPVLNVIAKQDTDDLIGLLRRAGLTVAPVDLPFAQLDGVLRISGLQGAIPDMPGFDEGRFWVQDPAAVAVADLALPDAPQGRVLDACAAPGGKTFRLASLGASVTAVDVHGGRLQRIREGLGRLSLNATIRHHDWMDGPLPDAGGPFDAVLVDAPCSGLGTVRRHPEIRWRRQVIDLISLPTTQLAIARNASTHVRLGGRLVYAVCSPEPEEGPDVVRAFLEKETEFSLERELSTAPPTADEDAHYAAVLRRRDSTE